MKSKDKNLHKRGDTYCCRITAPVELRNLRTALGIQKAAEVLRSLKTTDLRQARYVLPAVKAQILNEFSAELRALEALSRPRRPLGDHDVQRAKFSFTSAENRLDEVERLRRPSRSSIDQAEQALLRHARGLDALVDKGLPLQAAQLKLVTSDQYLQHGRLTDWQEWRADRRRALVKALRENLAEGEFPLVDFEVRRVIHDDGLDVRPDSEGYRLLGRELTEGWLASLKVQGVRDEGDLEEAGRLLAKLQSSAPDERDLRVKTADTVVVDLGRHRGRKIQADDEMCSHFEAYLKEKKGRAQPSALKQLRATFRHFIECVGAKKAADYTKQDVVKFKKGLAHFPANATMRFPGMTFNDIVDKAKKEGLAAMSTNTQREKLSTIAVFGRWLEDNADGVDGGMFETTAPARTDRKPMQPFSAQEVVSILNSNAFVGAKSDKDYTAPGEFRLRDWHYWLVLIAAFTGARANEIVQLEVCDLVKKDGILCFNLTTENGKSLKTLASKRLIPVHPQLLELGLEDYRSRSIAAGSAHLLSGIPKGPDGRRSTAATRWFGRFLQKIGVKVVGDSSDRGGTHRWRHTLADKIREGGGLEFQVSLILGHDLNHATATADYGQETTMNARQRFEVISKVSFPGVDFDKLK